MVWLEQYDCICSMLYVKCLMLIFSVYEGETVYMYEW